MDDRIERATALLEEGKALFAAGRLEAAEARFLASAEIAPSFNAWHNAGTVRQIFCDYEAAEALFRKALAIAPRDPRARAALGLVVLGQGRLAEGFALYDAWRELPELQAKAAPRLSVPLWNGEPVEGKRLLLWSEEGFGDQIMFARFVPLLKAAGALIAWFCNPAMTRLFGQGFSVEAVPADAKGAFPQLDYIVPTSRLPVVFMQRLAEPPAAPYLPPPRPSIVEGLTLGVFAAGNPAHPNDRNRSLPPEARAALMALPGAVSLAPEDTGARDFQDTAAVVAGLELVISVDSAVAHLAGALGKPVWLLAPAIGTDWRWLRERTDTPWYPTMRIFRQKAPGDWSQVLDDVRRALAERSAASGAEAGP